MRSAWVARIGWAAVSLLLWSFGCSPQPRLAPPQSDGSARGAGSGVVAQPTTYPEAKRIVAFGDLHGDVDAARRTLRLAGAIDDEDSWVGGDLVVVQTGDVLDRYDYERAILDLFARLEEEAEADGGRFITLIGNHEVINFQGNFKYVTPAGFMTFASYPGADPSDPRLKAFPPVQRFRAAAFLRPGPLAQEYAARNVTVRVGDTVFVHGGLKPEDALYGMEKINQDVRDWLTAATPDFPEALKGSDSPIWNRMYSLPDNPEREVCSLLSETLGILGAQRMVVGHTIQGGDINSACDGKIWRVDIGVSSYYGDRAAQALELKGDKARVLKENRVQN